MVLIASMLAAAPAPGLPFAATRSENADAEEPGCGFTVGLLQLAPADDPGLFGEHAPALAALWHHEAGTGQASRADPNTARHNA